MADDHQADAGTAEADFPGRSKRACSTSGNENSGGTKEQKVDPTPPDVRKKPGPAKSVPSLEK